jgi:peptidoglycan L-alanyl-D-glutamate endopeptidase CwlK
VLKYYDHSILCGHRGREEQEKAFKEKKTKVIYPHSKHNKLPSMAVDVAPYPIKWDNKHLNRFYCFAGFVLGAAYQLKKQGVISHDIGWGGDWDGDRDFSDQNFNDLVHFWLK